MSDATSRQKKRAPRPGPATQRFLDIAEIREDTVVMKDGTLRAVLLVSSVNFSLKSEEEQEAIIQGYVSFLNSLEHAVQVVIQSRRLNIDDYLMRLEQAEKLQSSDLLRAQIADYRAFVRELITLGEIMSKRFFVIVPYDPVSNKRRGFFSRLREVFEPAALITLKQKQFTERRKDLMTRVEHVSGSLASLGIQSAVLDTQSLIELYYRVYNPEVTETQKLADVSKLQVEL